MKKNITIILTAILALATSYSLRAQDIDVASLNTTPSADIASALRGLLPWMNVTSDSGLPYASSEITLRGTLSENGTLPLILVDGMEIPLEVIDPNDIETIEVLKDAAAAIYGARAAAGAIIIKTKNAGKLTDASSSIKVNAFTGITTGGDSAIDWKNDAFNSTRLTQNYKVSARGGNDVFSYYVGGHYYGQDGLYDKSLGKGGFNKVGMVGNFNARINNWLRYSVGFDYTYRQIDSPFWGGNEALFSDLASDLSTPYLAGAESPYSYDKVNSHYVMMKNTLSAAIIKGLDLEVSYAFANQYDFRTSRSSGIEGVNELYAPNFFSEIRDRKTDNSLGASLSYEYGSADSHSVKAVAGLDMQFGNYKHVPAVVGSLIDETISAMTIGDSNFDVDERKAQYIQTGIYANAAYSYCGRYSAELTLRGDGTSRLPKQNRWALSTAISLSWTLSNEDFLKGADEIDLLKIRYTFGSAADEALGTYYSYLPSVDNKKGVSDFLSNRSTGLPYYADLNYAAYADLSPERVWSHDLGLDAAFLGSRLSLTGDFFYRKVNNMLTANPNISAIYGDAPQLMNYGEASSTGFELALGWQDRIEGSDLSYSVKAMFADHITTVTSFPDARLSYGISGALNWSGLELSLLFNGVGKYEWPMEYDTYDASYFCLRDLRLGYTLAFREDSKVKSMNFGIIGQNLFSVGPALPANLVFTTGGTGARLPMSALLNIGINF